jgi:hypothetical protein
MKNGDVLSYCRARLKTLGRVEHSDTFNFENVPKPRLQSAFHLELGQARGTKVSQDNQEGQTPVTVRLSFAPARATTPIRDAAIAFADSVIAEFINPKNRLTQTNSIKNVMYNTTTLEPLANSNDNGLIVNLNFTMLVIISTR